MAEEVWRTQSGFPANGAVQVIWACWLETSCLHFPNCRNKATCQSAPDLASKFWEKRGGRERLEAPPEAWSGVRRVGDSEGHRTPIRWPEWSCPPASHPPGSTLSAPSEVPKLQEGVSSEAQLSAGEHVHHGPGASWGSDSLGGGRGWAGGARAGRGCREGAGIREGATSTPRPGLGRVSAEGGDEAPCPGVPCPRGPCLRGSLSQGVPCPGLPDSGAPCLGAPCHTGCRDGPKEGLLTVA